MSFFSKLFSSRHPLDSLRKAVQQHRWAEALIEGELVPRQSMQADEISELDQLVAAAGDALAEMNIGEGEAFLRAGDTARAREHFTLASSQARHPRLLEKARELLSSPAGGIPSLPIAAAACCPTGCSGEAAVRENQRPADDLDAHTHLDLLLCSYPNEIADRYASLTGAFLQAFLFAHEGKIEEALEYFEMVPDEERNDLFFFERGSLLARSGGDAAAIADLERALAINPHLDLASQTLVNLDLALGRLQAAETHLQRMLLEGMNLSFANGRLAAVHAGRGENTLALEHALQALEYGADLETFALAAALLEQAGRLAEAEACLSHLSTSGCGGMNLPLAEFWLRQQKNLEKALETFKKALRQEPGNPRWKVRIAQAYLACGWHKEGTPLLQQALDDPQLEPDLRGEIVSLLQQCR
jgi:tetratricopeptide (TPR) repeat protein